MEGYIYIYIVVYLALYRVVRLYKDMEGSIIRCRGHVGMHGEDRGVYRDI